MLRTVSALPAPQNTEQTLGRRRLHHVSRETAAAYLPSVLSANRMLTPDDHQKFAKLVSKKWKQVGRSLQKTCRALRDPVIDNLALEYDREGLYEQAYQMLLRFIQSEGKKATIARLIAALEDNGLISLAEELLGFHSSEDCS